MTISHRVCCGSALLAATVWAALLFVDSSPVRADESAVATSPVRAAEAAYEAITASASSENDLRTEELARQILVRWPRDPLSARVELELGRLFVLRQMCFTHPNAGEGRPHGTSGHGAATGT